MEPVNYGLIFSYGVQMTLVFVASLVLYATLFLPNSEIRAFFENNAARLGLILGNFWIISAGLVTVPQFASLFGAFGFNAEQSPFGIALVITLAFLKLKLPVPEQPTEEK